jgi:DNA-binding FadR family transcriptional regulator
VNRDTVALAYDALAREGLVEATVGRGTFVRADAPAPAAFEPKLAVGVERLLELGGRSALRRAAGVVRSTAGAGSRSTRWTSFAAR